MGLISIVVPVVSQLNKLVLQTNQLESLAEDNTNHDFEFIFVDNGSHHASIDALKDRAEKDTRYRVVILTRDFGPSALFLAGLAFSSGDCACYYAHDFLDPSVIVVELIKHWESGSKIVLGRWRQTTSGSLRIFQGIRKDIPLILNGFSDRLSSNEISYLLIDKQVMYILSQTTAAQIDIFETLAWTGLQPRLVEFSFLEDDDTGRQYSFQDKLITSKPTTDANSLQAFRTSLSVGILLAVLGALITIGLIVAPDSYQEIIANWWLLISSVSFLLGVLLSLLGLFGVILFRSLKKITSRPLFIVDSVINPAAPSSPEGREKLEKMILSLRSIRKQRIDYSSSASTPTPEEELPD